MLFQEFSFLRADKGLFGLTHFCRTLDINKSSVCRKLPPGSCMKPS